MQAVPVQLRENKYPFFWLYDMDAKNIYFRLHSNLCAFQEVEKNVNLKRLSLFLSKFLKKKKLIKHEK